jgi:hypothetical protein
MHLMGIRDESLKEFSADITSEREHSGVYNPGQLHRKRGLIFITGSIYYISQVVYRKVPEMTLNKLLITDHCATKE